MADAPAFTALKWAGAEHLPLLARIAAEVLGVDPAAVTPAATLDDDLNCDLLDRAEIACELEAALGLAIPDAEEEACRTVADLLALVARLVAAKEAAALPQAAQP